MQVQVLPPLLLCGERGRFIRERTGRSRAHPHLAVVDRIPGIKGAGNGNLSDG
jgi:hypothetical protein